jgi:glycosyltransferase involved in cell wall biosynthesis
MEDNIKLGVDNAFTSGDAFPLVSICIPTFNGAEFMREALISCRKQDYPNLELVISDDASTDSTMHIVRQQTKDFPFRVILIDHLPAGIGANWNNCIEHAKGKYVKFLFQDDLLEPTCISELVTLIESQPNVALAGSKRNIITYGEESEKENWLKSFGDLQINLPLNDQGVYMLSKKDFNYPFFYHGPLNKIGEPSTVLLNKECLLASGFFREDLNQVLDLEYWWRLMEKYTLLISPKYLASFRLHVNQATNKNRNKYLREYFAVKVLIFSKYIWKMPIGDFQKVVFKEFTLFKKAVKYKINTFWKVRL